jgi:hypothetical protein
MAESFGIGLDDLVLGELLGALNFRTEPVQGLRQSDEIRRVRVGNDIQILRRA